MKKLLFTLSFLTFLNTSFAAAPSPDKYRMIQKINISKITKNTTVKIPLGLDILKANDLDFGQLQLVDENNNPISFTIQETPAQKISEFANLELSSEKKEGTSHNLLDNNRLTEFEFDKNLEGKNPSTILVDFGKPTKLNRISFWDTDQSQIIGMEIKGGHSKNNLKTLKRRTKFKKHLNSDFPEVQFLKISLWGKKIRLDDILFYTPYTSSAYFLATPNTKYKFLFGGDLDSKRYNARILDAPTFGITATLENPQRNPLRNNNDIDGDGTIDKDDNCLYIHNSNQKDSDSDSWGDACDNAPKVKNYSQADSDRDLIGDIIDNCDFTPNKDQKDNDGDKIGNACDPSPNGGEKGTGFFSKITSSNSSSNNTGGFWGYILGTLTAFFGLAFFLFKKKKK